MTRWLDDLSDWLNPIFIKETRQALKSRQFMATFLLMLISAWLISMFGVLLADTSPFGSSGRELFFAYFVVLAVALIIVVPFTAFRSLTGERDMFTLELLTVSTLKPDQVVWGKMWSALLQMFMYLSAIAPFVAFTYLLRGIDILTLAFTMFVAVLTAVGLTQTSLVMSSLAKQRGFQVLMTLANLSVLVSSFFSILGIATPFTPFSFDSWEFWMAVVVGLSYFAVYFMLSMQIAKAQLTFEADNRSTGIRVTVAVLVLMTFGWIGFGRYIFAAGAGNDLWPALFSILIHAVVIGVFASTEPDVLSRRQRKQVARWGSLRVFLVPFLPGGARGFLYMLLLLLPGPLVFHLLVPASSLGSGNTEQAHRALIHWSMLAVIYIGFGAAVGRVLQRHFFGIRPAHVRVLTVLFAALVWMTTGILLTAFEYHMSSEAKMLLMLLNPATPFVNDMESTGLAILFVKALCVVVMVCNLRAVYRGVMEVIVHCRPEAAEKPLV